MNRSANPTGLWRYLALSVPLGVALIASTYVGSQAAIMIKRENQLIEVKGYAERKFLSDFGIWSGTFTTRAPTLTRAYSTLEHHRHQVEAFLKEVGVSADVMEISPVRIQAFFVQDRHGHNTNQIEGYQLSQEVRVASPSIDLIAKVAKRSSALVKSGVELSSFRPEYFYTQLEELKVSMLGQATADARRRGQELAEGSGSQIGSLRQARQGVFQITPVYSTEISDYGRHDTTSQEKAIKAVVTVQYAIKD